ncbi:MAG TPA: Ig-like domain-containing protein, partial [Xanthomonadaceae bacterium]|nr:Ig-like domain-containing protein [Xanthomonadaceae bacterium]
TSPYSMTLDSTTLANGSHTLTSKAYDAANNVGTSTAVSFSVSNATGGDTTPPTTSASESGSSGTITLSATASDNVGVTRVEFYVDGTLKGTDTTSPYSMTLDSTTLANGSHTLTSKAYDAANNVGTSTAVSFSVSNTTGGTQLIGNGGFESGNTVWKASSTSVISSSTKEPAHAGTWKAWLDGYGKTHTDTLSQSVTIPATATSATLTFWLEVVSAETSTTKAYDKLAVQVRNSSGTVLATLHTYSNLDKGSSYVQRTFDLSAYKGQTVNLYFSGTEDAQDATSFLVDDVGIQTQ